MLVIVILIGIVFIYFIRSSKIFDYVFVGKFLSELRSCGKCLGFWIFLGLEWLFNVSIFDGITISNNQIIKILMSMIGAVVLSLGTFYFIEGWKKHHTINYIT